VKRLSVERFLKWSRGFGLSCTALLLIALDAQAIPVTTFDSEGTPRHMEEVVAADPDRFVEVMRTELRNGNLASMGSLAETIIRKREKVPDVLAMHSIYLASRGDIERAKKQLKAALVYQKNNFFALCAGAMIKQREKEYGAAIRSCKKAVSLNKNHPYPRNIMGRVYFDEGKYEKAILSFRKAVELNPDFLPGHINLGATYYLLESYSPSINAFKRAINLNADAQGAHYGLAITYETAGKNNLAIKEFKRSLELKPNNEAALNQLGLLQLKVGKYKDARTTGLEMEKLGFDGAYIILGDAALKMGNPKEALRRFDKAPVDNPDVEYLKGYCYLAEGEYEIALSQMEEVLKKNISHFGAYSARSVLEFCLDKDVDPSKALKNKWDKSLNKLLSYISASIYASKGEWTKAEKHFQAAEGMISGFSIEGIDKDTLSNAIVKEELKPMTIGVLCYFKNMDSNASSEFEKARKINSDSFLANYWAAQICLKNDDRDGAIRLYENSIVKAPLFFAALYAIGELNFMKGRPEAAVKYYKRALEVKKDPGILIKLGLIYEKTGKIKMAESQYKEVINRAPALFLGYNQLAWLYASKGINLEKAMKLAQKADKLQPGNASILDTIGWIYYQRKDYGNAVTNLKNASNANPNNPTISYHLGVTYNEIGDSQAAKTALQKALKISADFREADKARKLLKQLD